MSSFIDWINKAVNKPKPQPDESQDVDDIPFDLSRYAPNFTQEEDAAARKQGYHDALEKYLWEVGGKLVDDGAGKRKLKSKAQMRADLEGEGLSFDELGELSDQAIHLPRDPDYESKASTQVPKDPYMRNAQIQGMINRLIQLHENLQNKGLSLFDNDQNISLKDRDTISWAHTERERVMKRLEVFGENAAVIEQSILGGVLMKEDSVSDPNEESDDPDVRRVEEMYRAECRGLSRKEQERLGEESYQSAKDRTHKQNEETGSHSWVRTAREARSEKPDKCLAVENQCIDNGSHSEDIRHTDVDKDNEDSCEDEEWAAYTDLSTPPGGWL